MSGFQIFVPVVSETAFECLTAIRVSGFKGRVYAISQESDEVQSAADQTDVEVYWTRVSSRPLMLNTLFKAVGGEERILIVNSDRLMTPFMLLAVEAVEDDVKLVGFRDLQVSEQPDFSDYQQWVMQQLMKAGEYVQSYRPVGCYADAILVRPEVWQESRGFCEGYLQSGESVDFCNMAAFRLGKLGLYGGTASVFSLAAEQRKLEWDTRLGRLRKKRKDIVGSTGEWGTAKTWQSNR